MTSCPRRAAAVLALAAVVLAGVPAAASAAGPTKPKVSAETAVVIDAATGEALYALRADRRRAVASTTKMVTALVARDKADLSDVITASDYKPAAIETQLGLRRGERLTLHDLLRAMLLPSANDAAITIAEGVSGTRRSFVESMNEKADAIGMKNTSFANPIGLDDPDHYSTARDLSVAARVLLRDRALAKIVDSPRAVLKSGGRPRTVVNRNRLVGQYPFVSGVKTGRTARAGYVLVSAADRDGAKVIAVVTGEPSEGARDTDSLALLRYGLGQFTRERVVTRRRAVKAVRVKYHDDRIDIVASRDATLTVRRGERVRKVVEAPDELEGPIPRGKRVGVLLVSYRNKVVRRVPLVTAEPVRGATAWDKISSAVGGGAAAVALLALAALAGLGMLRVRMRRRRDRPSVRGSRRR